MAKKTTNFDDDDIKRLSNNLRRLMNAAEKEKLQSLQPTTPQAISISQLVANGDAIIKQEAEDSVKKMSTAEEITSKNPYAQARIIVLKRMPAWKRNEIAEIEKTGNKDSRAYGEFIKLVADEGDKLSS